MMDTLLWLATTGPEVGIAGIGLGAVMIGIGLVRMGREP